MRKLTLLAVFVSAVLFGACVHRPYYKELVGSGSSEKELLFVLLNEANDQPLSGVKINVGSGTDRISVVTDANGQVKLPVKKSLMDPYTVVEVARPSGVERYKLERVVPAAIMPTEPPMAAPETPAAPPAEEQAADAGV